MPMLSINSTSNLCSYDTGSQPASMCKIHSQLIHSGKRSGDFRAPILVRFEHPFIRRTIEVTRQNQTLKPVSTQKKVSVSVEMKPLVALALLSIEYRKNVPGQSFVI